MLWMLNILDVHQPANRMEENLLTNNYTPDMQPYLQDNVWWKRPKKQCNRHQYLSPAHSSLSAQEFQAINGMTFVPHTLSTYMKHSFFKQKLALKGASWHQNDWWTITCYNCTILKWEYNQILQQGPITVFTMQSHTIALSAPTSYKIIPCMMYHLPALALHNAYIFNKTLKLWKI